MENSEFWKNEVEKIAAQQTAQGMQQLGELLANIFIGACRAAQPDIAYQIVATVYATTLHAYDQKKGGADG